MVFELLDEEIQHVLESKEIEEPTGPQKEAIPHILEGEHLLLVAPTGIGKTEAAMLPILHQLMDIEGPGFKCLYITPLRALNRDMLARLEEFGEALDISVAVRHGDTSRAERDRQSRNPPDVLITTPETLQILFTGKRLREHLTNVRFVVVDEIHEMVDGERGAQLSVGLERLSERAGGYQRVGLSATVGNTEEVANFLGGVGREVRIVSGNVTKEMEVRVESPVVSDEDRGLEGELQSDAQLISCMRRCKQHIEDHRSTLLFVNTRDTAEALAARYHIWDEDFPVGVHHGSLSKDIRIEMEDDFKEEELKGLICTSSLELGIDIGSTDFAIQYNSPRQVTRLIQRMGRAGHQVGAKSEGVIVASSPDEMAESLVITRRSMAGELEELRVRENPLTVLAHQLISMTMKEERIIHEAFEIFTKAYPFRNLSYALFEETLDQLKSIGLVYINGDRFRRTGRGMRYFYNNISMIPDERTFGIRDVGTRGVVGTLDESFVVSFAQPYATFITRGRSWRIVEVREDEILVEQVREIGSIPSWVGEDIPVPLGVAMEVGRLRREENYEGYPGEDEVVSKLSEFLREQREESVMPSDRLITIEMGKKTVILNVCFGTKVNETLAKILSVLLSARLGESVGVHTDPYRIILELPRNIKPSLIEETLESVKPEMVEGLIRKVLKNSSYLRWRFVYVAKKFGALDKDADHRAINFERLVDIFEGTPLYREALNKVLWEDLDMEGTKEVMRRIEKGELQFRRTKVSPLGRAGLEQSKELITPQRADHSILMALKKRLKGETLYLSCLNCQKQWRTTPGRAPDRIACSRCGGQMVAALPGYDREAIKLMSSHSWNKEEKKEVKRLYKSANLVKENGRRALMALAGRGVGPDAAARILSSYHEDEIEFLRDVLSAEITYARTKRFWD